MGRFVRPPLLGVQAHSWRIRVPPEAIVLDLGEPPILVTFGRKELTQTSNEGAIVRERGPPLGWPQSKGRANTGIAGDGFLRGSPRVRFNPRDERIACLTRSSPTLLLCLMTCLPCKNYSSQGRVWHQMRSAENARRKFSRFAPPASARPCEGHQYERFDFFVANVREYSTRWGMGPIYLVPYRMNFGHPSSDFRMTCSRS